MQTQTVKFSKCEDNINKIIDNWQTWPSIAYWLIA